MVMAHRDSMVLVERMVRCIYLIRGQKVMLDADLAQIYGVATARLNQQVGRNPERFPRDFVFQLTRKEFDNLMLQSATSSSGHGGRRKPPLVFTEHGAIMAATVLNSPQAVRMSVFVVRAFVKMREMLASHRDLALKLEELERSLTTRLGEHDRTISTILTELRRLMTPPDPPRRRIGFHVGEPRARYRVPKSAR